MSDKFDVNGKIVMDHTSKVMFFYAVMRDDFDIVRFRLEQNDDNINLVSNFGLINDDIRSLGDIYGKSRN